MSSFFLAIIIVILILSVSALFYAIDAFNRSQNPINAGYFMLIGIIGLVLSAYMLLQSRRKMLKISFELPKVITTILCQGCGFKNVRDFQRGRIGTGHFHWKLCHYGPAQVLGYCGQSGFPFSWDHLEIHLFRLSVSKAKGTVECLSHCAFSDCL